MGAAAAAAEAQSRRPYLSLFGSIRPYKREWLSRDVVAGVTLAALAIPEVMGYTKIAGTPVDAAGRYQPRLPIPSTFTEPGLIVYRFGVGLFYANAGRLSDEVLGLVDVPDPPRWFVLDAEAIDDIDFTGGKTLVELADELATRNIVFAVARSSNAVRRELDRFGVTAKIGHDRYFERLEAARDAFHSAQGHREGE